VSFRSRLPFEFGNCVSIEILASRDSPRLSSSERVVLTDGFDLLLVVVLVSFGLVVLEELVSSDRTWSTD
jgi:hypothetical protein